MMHEKFRGAALFAHGGGPTPVINASLAGAVAEALRHDCIASIHGALEGMKGLLDEQFIDLAHLPEGTLRAMANAPGSALGSSRLPMDEERFARLLAIIRRHEIRYFFYTGGNGSMGTAMQLARLAEADGLALRVVGIPKTIDNDIAVTDHTPGYPSAARFFALAVRDVGEDNRGLPSPVMVIEVLGRNAGWIAAATALARHREDDSPHLIYLPEVPLQRDRLLADVGRVYRRHGRVLVVVCEGQRDETGAFFGNPDPAMEKGVRDQLPGNLGHMVAKAIWSGLGVRARSEKPGLVGRSFSLSVPEVDRKDAWNCGESAVRAAVDGHSGVMVGLRRVEGAISETFLIPLPEVAYIERTFPKEWMGPNGEGVTQDFLDYAGPLVGPIPPLPRL